MSIVLEVVLGIVAGVVGIVTALYFAMRPYLQARQPKSWMPDATGDTLPNQYAP